MSRITHFALLSGSFALLLLCVGLSPLAADETSAPADTGEKSQPDAVPRFGAPAGAKRLMPDHDVWVDAKRKLVIMDGEICLREGQLEMFACPRGTKEHEAIVSVKTKAFVVHAGLLSIGAETGKPVQFAPQYVPASGTEIEVHVLWYDAQGKRHAIRAQEWIRNTQTGKPMEYPWVFAGSGFWRDEATGEQHYMAEAGDFICVSNFSSAMLDLPVESTQANQGLLFEAFTERIPPLRTPVRLVLSPKPKPKKPAEKENAQEKGEVKSGEAKSDAPQSVEQKAGENNEAK